MSLVSEEFRGSVSDKFNRFVQGTVENTIDYSKGAGIAFISMVSAPMINLATGSPYGELAALLGAGAIYRHFQKKEKKRPENNSDTSPENLSLQNNF